MLRGRPSRADLRYLGEDALSGYGEAADREVRALRAEGVRVEYRGWSGGREYELPAGVNPHSRDPLPSERARRGAPTIAHVFPERLLEIRAATRRGPLVAHTVWETDLLPKHWPAILDLADRIIVPTEWNRAAFVANGVTKPVVVVPYVVCDPVPGDRGVPLGLPDDVVVFYTISRWDERKKPAAVIEAFLRAFTADDPVALVVKTTPHAQYPADGPWGGQSTLVGTTMLEVARIMRNYPRPAHVQVEVDDWTPERVAGLHTRGDCFVSLPHSEGWGLGAFDAAAYGTPIVMTGWGGQLEFLAADSAFLVDYDLAPVEYWPPHVYPTGQHWAVPRLDHAVALMREVAADLGGARRRAAVLRGKVLHDYARSRVVAALFEAVPELPATVRDGGRMTKGYETAPTIPRRDRSRSDDLLLVGLTAGPWRTAYDNWVEMAERHHFQYELVGREVAEPYVPHATKWRILRDYFADLPRTRLAFYLDAADAFVCSGSADALARYRSYGVLLVFGAEDNPKLKRRIDVPSVWCHINSGGYVGEAGVIADALRGGYELDDWEQFGRVSDQRAMTLFFSLPGHEHQVTVDYRRTLVQNIARAEHYEELGEHRRVLDLNDGASCTSSVHFFGDNGPGYNTFAELYGLPQQELQESGRFKVPTSSARAQPRS